MEPWDTPACWRLIDLALDEDTGRGDLTTEAFVAADAVARGSFVARHELVAAGLPLAGRVFHRVNPNVRFDVKVAEGARVGAKAVLARVTGPARPILTAERTALNFVQRLCGVATHTRRFVDAVAAVPVRIADTRKTTPGYRALEKYAVRMGGGHNHRFDLTSGVLIKDNHVAMAGGLAESIARARAHSPHGLKIEVEVDGLEQLDQALAAGAEVILLDNFDVELAREAVRRARARAPSVILELSGGVTLDRVAVLASTGVDVISVGALTHSAPAVDIGLDFDAGLTP